MPAGRPRDVSPSPEECIRLGEELVEWATEETDEWRCLFQQWYSLKKKMLRKDWKALVQIPEFLPYYEMAQAALSVRCVDGTMKEGFGQRYIRLYDIELVRRENKQAKFMASLRKESGEDSKPVTVNIIDYSGKKELDITSK